MRAVLHVVSAGPCLTLQDFGRPGWRRFGLCESGAMDRLALVEGAAILGDDPASAAIEMFQLGGTFEAHECSLQFALTGAPMAASIDGHEISWNAGHKLKPGSRLVIGQVEAGVYGYLRLAGGVASPLQMGARATHLRAQIGGWKGRRLAIGDRLPIGQAPEGADAARIDPLDRIGGSTIRVVWGAQCDQFDKAERERFQRTSFRITPRMDRMGVCLSSDADPIQVSNHLTSISDAIVHGDIQVSGDGRPTVLMADHPVTGGYPRIATVITADLPRMAQMPPGQEVQFKVLQVEEAIDALTRQAAQIRLLNNYAPLDRYCYARSVERPSKNERGTPIKTHVDINADIGESFGAWKMGDDASLLEIITSANVACGFHAGDPSVMRKTVLGAKAKGVGVGAHPSLPDRLGFGRRRMDISPADLQDLVTYQISALRGFVEAAGIKLQHVFPHGALTAMAEQDEKLAIAIMDSVLEVDPELIYLALEGSRIPEIARNKGMNVKMVAFADRAYDNNKRLVSRKVPGAVIHETDQIAERVEQLMDRGEVTTIDGNRVPLEFDSIMLHGDSPGAAAIAQAISQTLKKLNIGICGLRDY